MRPRLLLVVAVLGGTSLAACDAADGPSPTPSPTPTPAVQATPSPRYAATRVVLEDATHGPQLCATTEKSDPPRCDGLDIVGWSWDDVPHDTVSGVRFGTFAVVGTFDGERFTLTKPPERPQISMPSGGVATISPCPPSYVRWRVVNRAKASHADLRKARAMIDSSPEAAGAWVESTLDTRGRRILILNVRFTGDLPAHQKRLRTVWGGALCVAPATRTTAELNSIRSTVRQALPGVTDAYIDVMGNRVVAQVWAATDAVRRAADARYGPGAVEFSPFLELV
ncbi:hypothetical protein [Asanoa iriomotensis]|uniref:Uncharacterized protein n=1 Tax=Asanoa iriomotensis TaxID=234613 RepID=A0ABQ4CEV0_9ACTN|nr:hypothetical protein [Asanoa iriomotensis]GIF61001.1 hypothetical protein Air01nite_70960 [Asanoa iriomotensis]